MAPPASMEIVATQVLTISRVPASPGTRERWASGEFVVAARCAATVSARVTNAPPYGVDHD